MERDEFRHGFPPAKWELAKAEARDVMYRTAAAGMTIAYSDLVAQIASIHLEAHDPRLARFLGQIAREDDDNRKGLTTVVVVHKSGDMQPGPGFFEMAESQGREVEDHTTFWIEELKSVQKYWRSKKRAK